MAELELLLDGLAVGGEAVGRDAGGRVVFVAGGAPGDRVRVRLTEEKRRFARGELLEVLTAGPARVTPPCRLAGRCGGCAWQHVDQAAQAAAKQSIVERALAASGAAVEPLRVPAPPLGYRSRARLTRRGEAVGFQSRRSHEVVDVDSCPALEPALDTALAAGRAALGAWLGEEGTLAAAIGAGERVQLAVVAGRGADRAALRRDAAALVARGVVCGVLLDDGPAVGDATLDIEPGRASAAGGFQQASRAANLELRRLVVELAGSSADLLELYAGDGNFTLALAVAAARLVAVEQDAAAAARLAANLRHAGLTDRVEVRAAGAAAATRDLARTGRRFEVAVLDPPRAGAADLVAPLLALAPPRLVYVSCDPQTLARDLAALGAGGYRARRAVPLDLMPQTSHVEVVCLLEAQGSGR